MSPENISTLTLKYVCNSDLGREIKIQRKKKRFEKKIRILIGVWNSKSVMKEKDKNSRACCAFFGDEARWSSMPARASRQPLPRRAAVQPCGCCIDGFVLWWRRRIGRPVIDDVAAAMRRTMMMRLSQWRFQWSEILSCQQKVKQLLYLLPKNFYFPHLF